jgi:hypothetical protein
MFLKHENEIVFFTQDILKIYFYAKNSKAISCQPWRNRHTRITSCIGTGLTHSSHLHL